MKALQTVIVLILFLGSPVWAAMRLGVPPPGQLYHGVFPGGHSGTEDDLTPEDLKSYEDTVGMKAVWVYFSNNWYQSRAFPQKTAEWVRAAGAVPFIRLMLRSDPEQNHAEPVFKLKALSEGKFDSDLEAWARGAKAFGSPLIVEWGTEVNGKWFSWNGFWNGGEGKGPKLFIAVFRRIVGLMQAQGAENISWVFHLNADDDPSEAWNRFENYYPGDDVVDWVGISAYGAQTPMDPWDATPFRESIDSCYPRTQKMAPAKPAVILEFGCTKGHPSVDPASWARDALSDLLSLRWPKIIGFSWWNEAWQNDEDRKHDTTMRVQDIPALAEVFRKELGASKDRILDRPLARTFPKP